MKLRIIYGRAGTGKSEYCFNEISKIIKREKKIYIITPEQFSFTAEKKLMNKIAEGATFNAEVITFSRMAYRIINEIGGGIWSNRIIEIKKNGKPTGKKLYYSIPRAYNLFKYKLDNIDRGGKNL